MKTQGYRFLIRIIQLALLTALLAFGTTAWAQNQSINITSAAELKAKVEEYRKKTLKRKDGRTILFWEIRKLPDKDIDALIEHEMSEDDANAYEGYLNARRAYAKAERRVTDDLLSVARAREAEADKRLAEINARNAEADKQLAEINARNAEADKQLATIYAEMISLIESNAAKLKMIYALTQTQGKLLTKSDHEYIKTKVMDKKELLALGLKQETMAFFEYLIIRPRLFEK